MIVNKLVSGPFGFAWAIPDMYSVSAVSEEICFDGRGHRYDHVLERIDFGFKNFASSRYGVSNNNNVMDIVIFYSRNETNADSY